MANRAYLFSSDCDPNNPLTWIELDWHNQRYYDSRHGLPLAWFFFFQPDDVQMIEVAHSGHTWQEVKLMAYKEQAITRFKENETLLFQIVGPRLLNKAFDAFLATVQSWPGDCLMVEPLEILEHYEEDYHAFRRILGLIADGNPNVNALKKALEHYTPTHYKDESDVIPNVIGYTYW